MKRSVKYFLVSLIISICCGQSSLRADLEVSASVQIHAVSDFQAPLATHGTWIEIGSHGRCWRPTRVAPGWQPYCYGSWVWTDCGWYWASDEPWGWACYHYGNWVYDSLYGWVWVPGVEWAPAWVYWRVGGGYCGWAPRAPRGVTVAPRTFVFVEAARFHEPVKPSTVIVNNNTIINKTAEIGNIRHETRSFIGATAQKVVVNDGPKVDEIQKATGKIVNSVSIREAAARNPAPPEAVAKINESRNSLKKNGKPPTPEPKPSPEGIKTDPDHTQQPQSPSTSPDRDKEGNEINPPERPTDPNNPDKKPGKPTKPKNKNSGKGKG